MNSSDRYERLHQLFTEARELGTEARGKFLGEQCGDDDKLREEVIALLALEREASAVLPMDTASDESSGRVVDLLEYASNQQPIPTSIGPYKVIEEIGRGGMGVVYKAEQDSPRRTVALKVIRPELATNRAFDRFRQEVALLGRLQHPGIAQIYEARTARGETTDMPYFAMELVEGSPLHEYAADQHLDLRQRLELFLLVVDAVHHAHMRGVIHRDLKPSNVLVDQRGQPKILDFGVAKATDPDLRVTTVERDLAQWVGTIPYMSPEQAAGNSADIDPRSDVYALGVLLNELLCGELPHDLDQKLFHECVSIISQEEPVVLGHRTDQWPRDIGTILGKAMERDRPRRYSSGFELAEDLRRFLADQPIAARPPSTVYRLRKFTQRNLAALLAVTTIIAALVIALVATTRSLQHMKESRALERTSTQYWKARGLLETEPDLWPRRDALIRPMQAWLAGAEELLASTIDQAATDGDPEGQRLAGVLEEIRERGLVDDLRSRLRFAEDLHEQTVQQQAEAWEETIFEVSESERYKRTALEPVVGLVPIGTDPASGLQEFWHVESGARPARDPQTGNLVLEEDSGLVMVLLPRGALRVPGTPDGEKKRVVARLDPFFLSKYEMTQNQWLRLTGNNPSYWPDGYTNEELPRAITGLHPVENITAEECMEVLWRADLALPTEAQWEYATRAGTKTKFWCGNDDRALIGNANVADMALENTIGGIRQWESWTDHHALHAPVGTFPANEFGLHEVSGNVWEWCRDLYDESFEPLGRGDGLCPVRATTLPYHVYRGGSLADPAMCGASRYREKPVLSFRPFGVRPARPLHGPISPPPRN